MDHSQRKALPPQVKSPWQGGARSNHSCLSTASHLAGGQGGDGGELEVVLRHAQPLGPPADVALAQFPALLVLDHAEEPERPVSPCNPTPHTTTALMPQVSWRKNR